MHCGPPNQHFGWAMTNPAHAAAPHASVPKLYLGYSGPLSMRIPGASTDCCGVQTQWRVNGGRCGVCGDPWNSPEPRDHELGGRYASGVIVRRYRPGDVVSAVVELTAAHGGYFEFRVCPVEHHPAVNSTTTAVPRDPSPDCLDRNVLQLLGGSNRGMGGSGSSRRYVVGLTAARMHAVDIRLPPGLECEHCLFQWKYHTGKLTHHNITDDRESIKHVNLTIYDV